MFFAYKDRKQIACLIVETYHQLSSAIILDDNPATAKELREKLTAFMTDSVGKKLKVKELSNSLTIKLTIFSANLML